jgi:enhancer of polycomb-like protein
MPAQNLPTFRRRVGRGGRILIDRRGRGSVPTEDLEPMVIDRMKYDKMGEDEDEQNLIFLVDPHSDR